MLSLRRALVWCLLAVTVLAAGCQLAVIRGSGDLVEQTRELGDFDRLDVSHSFDVEVRIGDEPAVTVTADDNVIEHVTMSVSGDRLRVGLQAGFQVRQATLQAVVTAPRLEEVRASGAVDVRVVDELAGERLQVQSSGASDVTAPLDVSALEVVSSGASTIRLSGSADTAELRASGASELALDDLQAGDVRARLSGASDAVVGVAGELDAELSGASSLVYVGEPTVTRQQLSGASSLERG